MLELADIIRRHGPEYLAHYQDRMLPSHRRVLAAIGACRTAQLGGHVYLCSPCQQRQYQYHSCKNRHCPKCQNPQATRWLERQRRWLLPTPYFLATFTLPAGLRPLARSHQKLLYGCLFQAAAQALQKLARDSRFVGGQIGMMAVLQTWTRDLRYHPHLHCLIPGGGITAKRRWRFSEKNFFLPATALSPIFRAKFRDALKKTHLFSLAPSHVWKQDWVVDCRPAGHGLSVLKYFAPYIYRVALSNRRLLSLDNGQVRFQFRDRQSGQQQIATLPAPVFLSRFLQHVLPEGFVKVRYYGFLHPKNRKLFETVLLALGGNPRPALAGLQPVGDGEGEGSPFSCKTPSCPRCGRPMILLETLLPAQRGPP
jgi:Putative transposase/Transposase zinc-binding domain